MSSIYISLFSGSCELSGIFLIVSTSIGRKTCCTMSMCHDFVYSSISEETIGISLILAGVEITLCVEGVGSHWSSHMCILLPLPTLHRTPRWTTSSDCHILLQAYDGLVPLLALSTLQYGKYRALYTLYRRESIWCKRCHPYLANIARLNAGISLKPIPPRSFDSHNMDHRTHAILCSWCLWPH